MVGEIKNVDMKIVDGRLVITVDLAQNFGPSSTGKTNIVASTSDLVNVPDTPGVQIGLNVIKKK